MLTSALFAAALTVASPASAQDLIAEIGPPVETGTNGAWARALAGRAWAQLGRASPAYFEPSAARLRSLAGERALA